MAATTSQAPGTASTCHDCGTDAPDGPVWAAGPDLSPVRRCWNCSDDRISISPSADSGYCR